MRFCSYNVRHGQAADFTVSIWRTAQVLASLEPDVIGVQELWRMPRVFDQAQRLSEVLSMEVVFQANHALSTHVRGNAVLTSGRIVRTDSLELPGGVEKRGCLLAEIELAGERFRFATAHLSLGRVHRDAQLAYLATELPDDLPLVISGDLNCLPSELGPLAEVFEFPEEPPFTYSAMWPRKTFDHIGHRGGWRLDAIAAHRSRASDHLPLVADLTLLASERSAR